ncbi:MAG: galactose-1-phosphate uridylyltransferase [Candidatus Omnitrophota bacterium]
MAELRKDPIVARWVIVETDEPKKPQDFETEMHPVKDDKCPFCYGNEAQTPPEIEAVRDSRTSPNTPGWTVRVVPNKFPALQVEGDLARRGVGIFDMSNGIGAHEVIIETPYHHKNIPDLLDQEVDDIIHMYCRRAIDLLRDKRFKYTLVFKNYGLSAGASLTHPHSQLIALPMIPKNVAEEIKGSLDYFEFRERCIFCDIMSQEMQDKGRLVLESKHFLAFCPFVSRFAFETWIVPKKHNPYFFHITNEEISDMAKVLKETLRRIRVTLNDPSYNFIIHTSPILDDPDKEGGYHWHLEIMPRLARTAGFEWGTGFYIVSTPPEMAAKYLREAK